VTRCKFTESGDSAICLVGALETTNGTRRDFPYECQATNNLIHDCGVFGKQIAGVYISRAKRITAGHNLIYNLPRAGICIGDGTWGGHIIEFNHIHHTVRETQDHGPFNSWGRTAEWCLVHSHDSKLTSPHGAGNVRAFTQETNIVRNNLLNGVVDYRPGEFLHALDLDDGSSNYHLYNNVCVGMAISIRDGAYRTVENNIIISPRVPVGFHVGYDKNHDVFRHNIIYTTGDIYFLNWPPPTEPWLQEIDHNLFFNPETPWLCTPVITVGSREDVEKKFTLDEWQARGYDTHSLVADPLFVNPGTNDYRVKDGSPALTLGFKNFEMDAFGLTSGFPSHLRD